MDLDVIAKQGEDAVWLGIHLIGQSDMDVPNLSKKVGQRVLGFDDTDFCACGKRTKEGCGMPFYFMKADTKCQSLPDSPIEEVSFVNHQRGRGRKKRPTDGTGNQGMIGDDEILFRDMDSGFMAETGRREGTGLAIATGRAH